MPLRLAACRVLLLLAAASASASASAAAVAESNSSANCTIRDREIVRAAFRQVANFPLPLPGRRACRPVRRLHFPSRNLTGAVNWAVLGNLTSLLTVDLSNNSLHGRIDDDGSSWFWRAPLLRAVDVSRNHLEGVLRFDYPSTRLATLNVSGNRFTSVDSVAGLSGVVDLDVSRNAIGTVPEGLRSLMRVRVLNLSGNHMTGRFPVDLPPLAGLQVLDISYNNFSGAVDADTVLKFGNTSFVQAGYALRVMEDIAPVPAPLSNGGGKHKRTVTIALISVGAAVTAAALAFLAACALTRRRRKKKKDKDGKTAVWEDDEVVVGAVKVAAAAPVVVLERPLMELTLADLAAATSGFGRESQLADTGGRSGAAYRAVLPGDLHVVVRVVEGAVAGVAEDADGAATEAAFRELARLRHPNILPLLGYCIAGNQKLVLYEYMEKGDLHRWLHELPVGSMDTEDICIDTMEAIEDRKPAGDWPTRYRIILGIARGLAFLHQGWSGAAGSSARRRPIVHGRLVPTNILLGDDMEPRISDFLPHSGSGSDSDETVTPASDVYRFGTLVFEVVTGQARWHDAATTSWARGVIRNRKGLNLVDDRLLRDETAAGTEAEREMAECLQVGFLCTASAPEKRPTMQQVVGLLKDVRPAPAGVPSLALGSLA